MHILPAQTQKENAGWKKTKHLQLSSSHSSHAYFNLHCDFYCFSPLNTLWTDSQMSSEPVCLCVSVYRAWRQAFSCLSGVWKSVYKCVSVHCIGAKLGKPQKHSCNSSQHHPMQEETGQEWKFKKEKKGVREESSWCDIFCGWDSIPPPPHTHTNPLNFSLTFPIPCPLFSSLPPCLFSLSGATLPCKMQATPLRPEAAEGEAR